MRAEEFIKNLMQIQNNLLNFALVLTTNRDDAYDLLQDTTLKAIDNQDKYTDNTNFKGWVFTIMRNIFINNYRRSSRAVIYIDKTETLYYLNLSQDSGFNAPEGSFAVKEINDLISDFPPKFKDPFSLHLAGYKYNEIAEKLDLPIGTIKSRIFTARRRLQMQLTD